MTPEERAKFDNPFATRYTRPGSVRYLFSDAQSAERLVDELRQTNWWGQIVGPHGVGKSTLLATLLPLLEQVGHHVCSVTLRDGQRRLPREITSQWTWTEQTLIVVDGYEQLSFLSRFFLKRRCRLRGAGLLVTAHTEVGLPRLVTLRADRELVKRLVQKLNLAGTWPEPTDEELDELLVKHGSNTRELLFDLYNRYERHNR